jgi:phosphatidylglycerol:prolipoprotein diacylglycerol transferase
MYPKLISIGDFFLPTYGVLVAIAFLVALWISSRLAKRSGLRSEMVVNLGIYCALVGMLGAKVLMILFDMPYFVQHPGEIFSRSTLQAAGVFQGGLVLAILFAIYYTRRFQMPWLKTADVFAPGIAIGHAIGRLGCFAAGCCWGVACDRPWAVTFTNPEANKLVGTPLFRPLHPTQLYEAAAEVAVFAFLYWRFGKPHRTGEIIGLYLVVSSILRFFIEFFRFHEQALPFGLPFSLTQWISLGLIAAGAWILWVRPRQVVPAAAH